MDREKYFETIDSGGRKWTGKWWYQGKNGVPEIKIKYDSPIELPIAKTTNKAIINEIKNNPNMVEKLLKEKIESTIQSKYNNKVKDSFNTYYKIIGFHKILEKISELEKNGIYNEDDLFNITFNIEEDKIDADKIKRFACQYTQYQNIKYNGKSIERGAIEAPFTFWCKVLKSPITSNKVNEREKQAEVDKVKKLKNEIYDVFSKTYKDHFQTIDFSFEDFKEMLLSDKCSYCGITLQQIQIFREKSQLSSKSGRGFSLEIDRKEPNLEYKKNNCCMSCYWCNNAKTDEFLAYEFKEIAWGINQIWNKKLKEGNSQSDETVSFPKDSSIWNN